MPGQKPAVDCYITDSAGRHIAYLLDEKKLGGKTVQRCRDHTDLKSDGFMMYYVCVDGEIVYSTTNPDGAKLQFKRECEKLGDTSEKNRKKHLRVKR